MGSKADKELNPEELEVGPHVPPEQTFQVAVINSVIDHLGYRVTGEKYWEISYEVGFSC
jgi:hypothetical protein